MADTFVHVLVVGLASFGLTWIVRYTHGPFNLLIRFRQFAGVPYTPVYADTDKVVDIVEEDIPYNSLFGNLVGCFWCLCTWISLILVLLSYAGFVDAIMTLFGAVGFAGFMHEVTT